MTQITLRHGDEKRTVDADVHNGYLVIPGTKIPLLDEKLLATLNGDNRERIAAKIEAARADDKQLTALWREGEVLRFAHERPGVKFVYVDFLQKFQNRNFDQHPVEDALSPVERQYVLASVDLATFRDQPSVVMGLLRSLPAERTENLLNSNAEKIAKFVLHFGTATDMREFLSLVPEKHRQNVITQGNYALLLDAMSNNKKDAVDVMLEFLPEGKQGGVPKELQLKILKSAVGEPLHKNFNEAVYLAMLPVTAAACKAEGNTGAVEHAYKLAVLFSKLGAALNYLEKWTDSKRTDSRQPVHDILLFNLPPKDTFYDRRAWEKLATEHGQAALKYFGNAPKIEDALQKLAEAATKVGHTPIELARARPKDLEKAASTLSYDRFMENPEWASLCATLSVDDRVFEHGLELLKRVKKEDKTPNIGIIEGSAVGRPGYYMRKLAANDPRNLLIGKMVGCCNHIDHGATSDMAETHVLSPDAACYVIFKEEEKGKPNDELDKPVAKSTGWMSTRNNFVFNSWERLSSDYTPLCEPFFSEAGRRILAENPEIGRVLLGRNRDNVNNFRRVSDPERPRSPRTSSYDADTQYLISERTRSAEVESRIKTDSPEPTTTLREEIIKSMKEYGLSSKRMTRIEGILDEQRYEIDHIQEAALKARREIKAGDSISSSARDFAYEVDSRLDSMKRDFRDVRLGLGREFRDEGLKWAAAFPLHVAIKHYLGDLVPIEDQKQFIPHDYRDCDSLEGARDTFSYLGGVRNIHEYAKHRPKQFALRAGLSLALLFGAGSGVRYLNNQSNERQARENSAIKLEEENPGIFRGACNLEWAAQFKDVDITNVEAVRSKCGDKIKINDIEIPVEIFVEQVAPTLNVLEEIRKKTPADKWNIRPAGTHQQHLEQTQPEQRAR